MTVILMVGHPASTTFVLRWLRDGQLSLLQPVVT
jgi:hypothetical protein